MKAETLAKGIKLIILDCDGVLTDGGLYYDHEGNVTKRFNVLDGLGIKAAQACDLIIGVITGLEAKSVASRMNDLGIVDYYAGHLKKMACIKEIKEKYDLDWHQIAYIGDDWVDLAPMRQVGLPIAVANAMQEVKEVAVLQTEAKGGHGAVREALNFIMYSQGKLEGIVNTIGD
ncbi:KdsC family phosphatase [Halodesulfovibrio marinisediminis]|uniref:3-deoxy-D-manno-octulosonate 8-phosphate phosphatase (KDO 8-P phosphatase) n=1 Tax=Halodesulfovibrio marinisediminis DSM 17456 TaxID=1121457 RepID=A0A1N6E7D5_9BACT|nr:HAD hydrolase family protein [Halodesulfovibrio marinisediminis]SIN78881.1 3-deoxy-D-manno-octulosonate 8-phosphate phosphatase (KDO 8-P phosphatase) [Halodesulfovibrio marinisediminis DSM 17456]